MLAHPFDDGTAVTLDRSLAATAAGLGIDGPAYRRLIAPLATGAPTLLPALLGPARPRSLAPPMLRFAAVGSQPAATLARLTFRTREARALFAGLAAHSVLPLEAPLSAAYGLVLAVLGHVAGWPVAAGGSQALAEALASLFRALGGEVVVGHPVASLGDLPDADHLLFDVAPVHLAAIAAERLPASFRRQLARHRYGAAAFKVDWALSDAVPWTAARRAAGPARFTSAARSRRLPKASGRSIWGRAPSGRSCWRRNRACSIRLARRQAGRRCGRIATFRSRRPST